MGFTGVDAQATGADPIREGPGEEAAQKQLLANGAR